jgi:pimeloyl-ACP methyl ester carboxylesterase
VATRGLLIAGLTDIGALAAMLVLALPRQAAPPPRPASASLHPCTAGRVAAECGSITVFEDRAGGRGRTIDINFTVARAENSTKEAVFVFAGGPGDASTNLAGSAGGALASLRPALDLVYVDQRGTGQSHPLNCPFDATTNPPSAFGHVFDPAAVARCRERLSRDADLTKYTTDLAVADVDDVRAALGYERISVFGTSYGTRMAQAYLKRFPSRVRSAVIDGVVPFDNAIPLTYAASAQQALDRIWTACTSDTTCLAAHPHPADDFAKVLHRFDAGPVATHVLNGYTSIDVRMSRGDFGYAVRGIMYSPSAVTRLPDLVGRAAASGDVSDFATAYWSREVGFEQSFAYGLHFSVFCAEDIPFPTEADIERATANTFLGRYLFDEYRNACQAWVRGPITSDFRKPVDARAPVLLVSGAFDPVTPPEFAARVARSLPVSLLITSPTGAHGSSFGCPRAAVLQVLARGSIDGVTNDCGG